MDNKISSSIKFLMQKSEITSSELARCTGITQPVIYRIASGETDNPKINTLIPIAKYFNTYLDHLVDGSAIAGERTTETTSDLDKSKSKQSPLLSWGKIAKKEFHRSDQQFYTHSNVKGPSFCIKITDDSFLPNFPNETVMIFDSSIQPINEDVVLASYKDETPSIKKYLVDGSDVYLKPIRAELTAKLLNDTHNLSIFGVLIETVTFYKRSKENKE